MGRRVRSANRSRRRGVMLIITLWLTVILSILALAITSRLTMQTRLMSMRRHRLVAEGLAQAGLAKAIVDLKNDLILDNTEKPQPFDGEGDIWKRPEEGKKEEKLGKGTYTVEVVDEESKININKASVALLIGVMMEIGYEEEDAKLAAASVIDWRDGDNKCSIEGVTDQLEGEVYAELLMGGDAEDALKPKRKDSPTIRMKDDEYLTADELLSVYGVTPDLYFGPGSPEAEAMMAEHPEKWEYLAKSKKRFQIKKSRSRFADSLPVGLRDCVTVYTDGSINVNTASMEVLSALLRASGVNTADPESGASRIVEYRRDGRKDDLTDKKAFRALSDIDAAGAGFSRIAGGNPTGGVVVISKTFTITSTGVTQRYSRTVTLVVRRNWETYVREDSSEAKKQRWEQKRDGVENPLRSDEADYKSGKLGPDERTILWPAVRAVQWIEP